MAHRLRLAAGAILLVLACCRMMLTESLSPPWTDSGGVAAAPDDANGPHDEPIEWGGPTPASSMGMAVWILLAGVLWAIAQIVDPQPMAGRWALRFIGLFAVGAAASLAMASNRAAARNHSVQFLGYLVSFWLLLQLLRTKAARQAGLVMVLAAGLAFAVYLIYQNYWENPDFIQHKWPEERAKLIEREHWTGDEPMLRLWDERVRSAEAKGFAVNANMAAALLVVVVSASAGWAVQKWTGPAGPLRAMFAALAGATAAIAFFALLLTRSRAGISAGIVALVLFAVIGLARRWAARNWRPLAITAAGVVVVAAIAVTTWSARMTQPPPDSLWYRKNAAMSLLFRWQYWVGAARVWRSHPLGVGGGNFRDAYVELKLPAALEDVDNPHNFLLAALVEYGPLGAIALAGLLGWVLVALSRPPKRDGDNADAATRGRGHAGTGPRSLVVFAIAFGLALAVVRGVIQWPNYGDLSNWVIPLLVPVVVLVLMLTRDRVDWPAGLGETWVRLAIGCGLAGFLLACTIDFGMTQAGPATAFWTLAAIALAGKLAGTGILPANAHGQGIPIGQSAGGRRRAGRPIHRPRRVAAVGLTILLIGQFFIVYLPVKTAEGLMWQVAKRDQPGVVLMSIRGPGGKLETARVWSYSDEFYRRAVWSDSWSPEIPAFMASQLHARLPAGDPSAWWQIALEQVQSLCLWAMERDPCNPQYRLSLNGVSLRLAQSDRGQEEALRRMAVAAAWAPHTTAVWQQLGQARLESGRGEEAAKAFARAIAIDETIRRYDVKHLFALSDRARGELHEQLKLAQAGGGATTRPNR